MGLGKVNVCACVCEFETYVRANALTFAPLLYTLHFAVFPYIRVRMIVGVCECFFDRAKEAEGDYNDNNNGTDDDSGSNSNSNDDDDEEKIKVLKKTECFVY